MCQVGVDPRQLKCDVLRVAVLSLGRRVGALFGYYAARALATKCSVMALISRQAENRGEWWDLPLASLVEIDTPGSVMALVSGSLNVWGLLPARARIAQFAPDVIYVPMQSPLTPVLSGLLKGIPRVLTEHDPLLHRGDRGAAKLLLQHIHLRQATRVIVLSKKLVPMITSRGFPASRVDVIPHGSFEYYRERATGTGNRNSRRPTLLFFGRFQPYKGLSVLLDAFAEVRAAIPSARLRIVGSGSFSQYRESAARITGIELTNRWVADEEVGNYFLNADAVVLPYTEASQSGVVAIAASFGLPVVASDVGGLGEQVKHGVSGLLVPPGSAQALAEACVAVLRDCDLRARLSQGANWVAENEMNWGRIGDLLYDTCQKAVRNHRRGSSE